MSSDSYVPNLGRFSIQIPDASSELRVGSFWKRKQSPNCDANSEQSTSYTPNPKRLATNVKRRTGRSGSFTTPSPSQFSSTGTTSSQTGRQSTSSDSAVRRESSTHKTVTEDEESQATSTQLSNDADTVYTDTQVSHHHPDPPKNIEDASHESVVVDVDPMNYLSQNESSQISVGKYIAQTVSHSLSLQIPSYLKKRLQKKTYPKKLPYNKILSHVTFVLSGFENPRRSKLRDEALAMGARYQPQWNKMCTHLICAFKNTPKYKEVRSYNGRVVREHWIQDCSRQRELLDWRNFKLGKYPYPDSEEELDIDDLDYVHSAATNKS